MKKLYSVTLTASLALSTVGYAAVTPSVESAAKLDTVKVCDVKANGINKVLDTAEQYNAVAKKYGVEFKRLGMTTTQYIDETRKALKANEKKVKLLDKKGKVDKKLPPVTVEYAAHRACVFAIAALQLKAEGETTWRAAVPGDGFKY
jgi:DNA repair ATPase RecN